MATLLSNSYAEDSDVTVASDDQEELKTQPQEFPCEEMSVHVEEDGQATESDSSSMSCGGSPSILHPRRDAALLPEVFHSGSKDKDIVPGSSDDIDTTSEGELSQEYLPSTDPEQPNHSTAATQDRYPSLNQICKDQESLQFKIDTTLANYGKIFPSNFVKTAENKLAEIEGKLKGLGEVHQAERKKLVAVHVDLSQGSSPIQDASQSLRSQLVSLAVKQKQLLQCFVKQKEIARKLGELEKRRMNARKKAKSLTDSNDSSYSTILPSLKLVKPLTRSQAGSALNDLSGSTSSASNIVSSSSDLTQPIVTDVGTPRSTSNDLTMTSIQNIPRKASISSNSRVIDMSSSSDLTQPTLTDDPRQANISSSGRGNLTQPVLMGVQSNPRQTSASSNGRTLGDLQPAVTGIPKQSSTSTNSRTSSSDLTQPVPLDILIKHRLLKPGSQNLTCTILGCDFNGSLLEDGSIQEVHTQGSPVNEVEGRGGGGGKGSHRLPQQWTRACWSRLGHQHRKTNKKQAYNVIFYGGKPLSYYCEQYSLQQVSSYLSHKRTNLNVNSAKTDTTVSGLAMNPVTAAPNDAGISTDTNSMTKNMESDFSQLILDPPPTNVTTESHIEGNEFDLNTLLTSGDVLLVPSNSQSLILPQLFWEDSAQNISALLPEMVLKQLETELCW